MKCQSSFLSHKFELHVERCGIKSPPSLFPIPPAPKWTVPTAEQPLPGLFIFPNFLDQTEQNELVKEIRSLPNTWISIPNGGSLCDVLRFGINPVYNTKYTKMKVDPMMPDSIYSNIFAKLQKNSKFKKMLGSKLPNESNIMRYVKSKRHVLAAHIDDRNASENIFNLSLVGSAVMTYKLENFKKDFIETGGLSKNIPIPKLCRVHLAPGTLQIMSGVSRYEYTHEISNADLLSEDRLSITMRNSI